MEYGKRNFFYINILLFTLISFTAYASIFTFYPLNVSLQPVSPPIVLQDPSQPGVSVSTGAAGASASISYLIPYSISLSQGAIYSSTLDSWPQPGWQNTGAFFSITTPAWVGRAIRSDLINYGVDATYHQLPIDTGYTYYLASYARSSTLLRDKFVGVSYYSSSNGYFIGCAIGNGNNLSIARYTVFNPPTVLNQTTVTGISTNTWYFLVCQLTYTSTTSATVTAYLYNPSTGALMASTTWSGNPGLAIDSIAMFVSDSGPGVTRGFFDELVFSYRDPRFVCITNVPSGWRVELYNGTTLIGSQVSSGSSTEICFQIYGPSPPQGSYSTILRQGVIRVYDPSNILRASLGPQLVVGGSLYRLDPQASTTRILNVVNLDGKSYYGLLTLSSYSVSGFSSIQIRICGSTCSSWISIPPPPDQTTEVQIPPGTSYVELSQNPSQVGAQASISLFLNYSTLPGQGGAQVAYPIAVSIR